MTLSNILSSSLSKIGNYSQPTAEDYLWNMQKQVILELAQKESCIIVGRCADYILRDKARCLRVFIHASMEKRAERIVKVYGDESKEPPEKRLKDKDKRRRAFYNYYTDTAWGDPHTYDICLDSGTIGFESCRDILCALYEDL